jgi:F-type H+-transporting ATPase subunit delta
MARSTTARRYAEAVFELARRDGTTDAWLVALEAAAHVLGSDEVLHIVENPAIPSQDRLRAVHTALGAESLAAVVGGQLDNLVALLVERRRLAQLPAVAREYARLVERQRGVVGAVVTSAVPLTADETAAVLAKVEAMTGTSVSLTAEVDPAIIGGLTVRVGDRLLDASVRGRLERLRAQLLAGSRQAHGTGA